MRGQGDRHVCHGCNNEYGNPVALRAHQYHPATSMSCHPLVNEDAPSDDDVYDLHRRVR